MSDPSVEEAIYDRNSFQKFLGIDLLSEAVPDETTILNFRHLLEKHGLQAKFFEIVREILETKGLLLKRGTVVDTTIVSAPTSTKNKDKKRDPEMSSTKKGGAWFFGMKANIGVDADSGLVHSVEGTTAKVEHPFQVIKCQWKYKKVRYRGLFKNTMQLKTLFILFNLYRVRKTLPQML